MQLTHIALWTNHLERLRDFYVKYYFWNNLIIR